MKLTVVYDNEIYKNNPGKADHGFSCLIETKEEVILFDTGADGTILLDNMKLLHINPNDISTIIISHEHYDHNGGLSHLTNYLTNPTIYRLKPSKLLPNSIQKKIEEPYQITPKIFSTGSLPGFPKNEQSLLLKRPDGIVILTGCSHPGLHKIFSVAEQKGKIIGLIGGFHGFSDFDLFQSLQFIYPCHCTKYKTEIKKQYPTKSYNCGVGLTISL